MKGGGLSSHPGWLDLVTDLSSLVTENNVAAEKRVFLFSCWMVMSGNQAALSTVTYSVALVGMGLVIWVICNLCKKVAFFIIISSRTSESREPAFECDYHSS
jgi:hypothetical protein